VCDGTDPTVFGIALNVLRGNVTVKDDKHSSSNVTYYKMLTDSWGAANAKDELAWVLTFATQPLIEGTPAPIRSSISGDHPIPIRLDISDMH
jgi:hypothetical protein